MNRTYLLRTEAQATKPIPTETKTATVTPIAMPASKTENAFCRLMSILKYYSFWKFINLASLDRY